MVVLFNAFNLRARSNLEVIVLLRSDREAIVLGRLEDWKAFQKFELWGDDLVIAKIQP
jgi:hypothetical protein